MRSARSLLLLLVACHRTPPPSPAPESVDAGASAAPSASVVVQARDAGNVGPYAQKPPPVAPRDAAASPPMAPLPLASDKLEVVAIGKTFNSRILWAQTLGDRFWLSAQNLDAFADGDGALTKGPDILAKLPYKPGQHRMSVVGTWPVLYAMRTKNIIGRMESPEPTFFTYKADEGAGTWTQVSGLNLSWFPLAFVPWKNSALVMSGAIQFNAEPGLARGEGATGFWLVASDGTVSSPAIGQPPSFMAWAAAADGEELALLGTIAPPFKKGEDFVSPKDVYVWRSNKATPLTPKTEAWTPDNYGIRLSLQKDKLLAVPAGSLTAEETWKPNGRTMYLVDGEGKKTPRTMAGNESCTIDEAHLAGEAIYAIRRCYDNQVMTEVVRIADGKTEKLALPNIVRTKDGFRASAVANEKGAIGCEPAQLVVRGADDLWVWAKCGGDPASYNNTAAVPLLLRRGRPQEPLVIP